jgi:Fic family protein
MLYTTPQVSRESARALRELDDLRARLGGAAGTGARWLGRLRRQVRAATMHSSVAIEGFTVPAAGREAIVSGAAVPGAGDDDRMALASYARAIDHVGTLAIDPRFEWSDRVLLDLHFEACAFQPTKSPGLLRTDPIYVTAEGGGPPAYTGPPADELDGLLDELVAWLADDAPDTHIAVRAAMAHLHLVSVHPFQDGNGRISRILQSLVLARGGLLSPEFSSIEEYLGRHTGDYYRVLQQVQGGSYQPDRDAGPWVKFCITAHIDQANTRLRQIDAAARRWHLLELLVDERNWPERLVIALEQALFEGTDRSRYSSEAGVSAATATNDLRRLADAGWLTQHGRGRGTRYNASATLRSEVDEPS